jgi:endonuclease/exonuclease/phosphatase (EEP) superfamily protein YafD
MSITIIVSLVALGGALLVFLFMAKRVVRWAIRLALLGIVALALLVGAVAWWWYYGAGGTATAPQQRDARPGTTRRANSR